MTEMWWLSPLIGLAVGTAGYTLVRLFRGESTEVAVGWSSVVIIALLVAILVVVAVR